LRSMSCGARISRRIPSRKPSCAGAKPAEYPPDSQRPPRSPAYRGKAWAWRSTATATWSRAKVSGRGGAEEAAGGGGRGGWGGRHARMLAEPSLGSQLMQVVGFDHVVLAVSDVERSLSWYMDVLGLTGVRVEEWRRREVPFPSVRVSQETIIDLIPRRPDGGG